MICVFWILQFAVADVGTSIDIPDISSQTYNGVIGDSPFVLTNDSQIQAGVHYNSSFSYTYRPFVYQDYRGQNFDVIKDVSQMDVAFAYGHKQFRYGVSLPLVMMGHGETLEYGRLVDIRDAGIGNVMFDLKWQWKDARTSRIGVAMEAKLQAPIATTTLPLYASTVVTDVEIDLDMHHNQSQFVFNVGHRQRPSITTADFVWGAQLYSRLGWGYAIADKYGLSTEYTTWMLYSHPSDYGVGMELFGGTWLALQDYRVRAGVAKGVYKGIGIPTWRALLSISSMAKQDTDMDADGITDAMDICPSVPEDKDGFEDEDGCPENTIITIPRKDDFSNNIRMITWNFGDNSSMGSASFKTQASTLTITAEEAGYVANSASPAKDVDLSTLETVLGSISVVAEDAKGNRIPTGSWNFVGATTMREVGIAIPIALGVYEIQVSSKGYRPSAQYVEIEGVDTKEIHVVLEPTKVNTNLDLTEKVYFHTGSYVIDSISYPLLQEVIDILQESPQITLVLIEGHTDNKGNDAANKKLSQDRATAVKNYLITHGINPARLQAIGYGEERPLTSNDTEEGRSHNRRVVFTIIETKQP